MGADGKSRVHRDVFGVVGNSGSAGYDIIVILYSVFCILYVVVSRVILWYSDYLSSVCSELCSN